MKYINLFETQAAYDAAEKYYPNVSYIEATDEVVYAESDTSMIVAKFTTTSANQSVKIANYQERFSEISIEGTPQTIGTGALNYTFETAGEHEVDYKSVNTTIGVEAFYQCNKLTSIIIPNSITELSSWVFGYDTGLTSVTVPDSVTSVGIKCFYNCTGLRSVSLGNSVTTIGNEVFNGCNNLTSITSLATTPPTLGSSVFQGVPATCAIYVPAASVAAYQAASGWSDRAAYIQAIQ